MINNGTNGFFIILEGDLLADYASIGLISSISILMELSRRFIALEIYKRKFSKSWKNI
jgi:hypothetical protein